MFPRPSLRWTATRRSCPPVPPPPAPPARQADYLNLLAASFAVPGGAQLHLVKSAPHLLMYAESGVANRMVFRFLTTALRIEPPAPPRPSFF